MEEYIPPSWHNNFDNRHLLDFNEDGTITPKPVYQEHADRVNREQERIGSNARMIWDEVTSSFCLRFTEPQ